MPPGRLVGAGGVQAASDSQEDSMQDASHTAGERRLIYKLINQPSAEVSLEQRVAISN